MERKGVSFYQLFENSNGNGDRCDDVTQSKIGTYGDFIEVIDLWKFRLNPTCTDEDMKCQKSPISRQYYLKI